MDTLLMTVHNLLFGGIQTVVTTLMYALLVLLKYPKIQGARAASRSWETRPRLSPAHTQ